MNHLMAVKKSYLQRQPEIVENVLRALTEGLAFTWAPKSKSAVLKSVMRRLRITEIGFAEDGYQDLLTRGGLEKKPHPSMEGVRNVQRLMLSSNPRVGEIKLEEIVDRSIDRASSMTAALSTGCIAFILQNPILGTYCNRTGIAMISSRGRAGDIA
jgi:hypothetical protein